MAFVSTTLVCRSRTRGRSGCSGGSCTNDRRTESTTVVLRKLLDHRFCDNNPEATRPNSKAQMRQLPSPRTLASTFRSRRNVARRSPSLCSLQSSSDRRTLAKRRRYVSKSCCSASGDDMRSCSSRKSPHMSSVRTRSCAKASRRTSTE